MHGLSVPLWTIAIIASLYFLRAAAQLLIPIAIGVLLSYALEPVVAWLARHKLPRAGGATLVMVVLLASTTWGLYSLKDNIVEAVDALPQIARRAQDLLASGRASGPAARIQEAAEVLQGNASPAGSASSDQPSAAVPDLTGAAGGSGGLFDLLQRTVGSIFALAGHVAVVFFLLYFLLLSGHHVRSRVVEIAGPDAERRKLAATIIDEVNAQVQRFLLVRLFTALVVGVATWGALAWLGVSNAPVWGIMAGLFNSIPYLGPVIVSGGLFGVGIVQGAGVVEGLQMAGVALLITGIEGWLVTPPLMGRAERMSVLAVFIGLLLWTWLWGAWGTLLAVPMLVVIKAVADHIDRLKPIGRLMAP